MKTNSQFLKFGCSTIIQTSLSGELSWTLQGSGEVIPATDGLAKFTAPNSINAGKAVITCTNDADPVETDAIEIQYGSHLHVVADILKKSLSLSDDQIILGWENFKIPNDKKNRIFLVSQNPRPIGNNIQGADEVIQSINVIDSVNIEVYGLTQSVSMFAVQVCIALNSRYSERKCEENSLKIIGIPTALSNVSGAEGSSGLKRFVGTFNIFYNLILSKQEDFYDEFSIQFLGES